MALSPRNYDILIPRLVVFRSNRFLTGRIGFSGTVIFFLIWLTGRVGAQGLERNIYKKLLAQKIHANSPRPSFHPQYYEIEFLYLL